MDVYGKRDLNLSIDCIDDAVKDERLSLSDGTVLLKLIPLIPFVITLELSVLSFLSLVIVVFPGLKLDFTSITRRIEHRNFTDKQSSSLS